MEEFFREFASYIALSIEALAATFIAVGAFCAVKELLSPLRETRRLTTPKRIVWLRFSVWLLLSLEFQLAADVVRTAISPTWEQIGQLAAVALIRTFLNYFLEKDAEKYADLLGNNSPTSSPETKAA